LIMCWSCEKSVLTESLGTAVTAVRIKFARTEQFQQWFIASAPGEVNTGKNHKKNHGCWR
jgi:hypothetical protein